MESKRSAMLAAVMLCACTWHARADDQVVQYDKLIKSTQNIGVLGKDLAGDSTNFYTGSTSFSSMDLSIPGNNGLSVSVGRSYSVDFDHMQAGIPDGLQPEYTTRKYAFGDWDIDIPHLSGIFTQQFGWQINSTTPLNRCSVVGQVTDEGTPATGTPKWQTPNGGAWDFWHGYTLHLPGDDQSMLLASLPNNNRPGTGGPYHWTTNKNWWFSCLSTTANNAGGQGFLGIAPDGTKYWFNWLSQRNVNPLLERLSLNPDDGPPYRDIWTYRAEYFLLPTRVEDRFGNWVEYEYSNDSYAKLLSITSNDGRELTLAYNTQGFVGSISDGTRTIEYQYTGNSLSRVIQPDGSSWQYGFGTLASIDPSVVPNFNCDHGGTYDCIGWPRIQTGTRAAYVIHPSGARVDFKFDMHFQWGAEWIFGITEKAVTGAGLPSMKWYYAFSPTAEETKAQCEAGACPTRVWTDEVSPDYRITRRMYGLTATVDESLLLQVAKGIVPVSSTTTVEPTTSPRIPHSQRGYDIDIIDDPTPVVPTGTTTTVTGPPQFFEEIDYTYRIGARLGVNPYYARTSAQVFWSERRLPKLQRKTHLQGEVFTWGATQFDSFDRALSVTKSSTLGNSKTDTTAYYDDLGRWILGQVERTATNGILISRTEYDANSLPWKTYGFGNQLQQTLTYKLTAGPEDGTLATVKDAKNNTTTLSNWKRDIPQRIDFPATPDQPSGTFLSAVVNDYGWITATTDENGYKTCYAYDDAGRLSQITYPSESTAGVCNTSTWAPTYRTFSFVGPMYGLPNHWRLWERTGNGYKVTHYDALRRPVVQDTYDYGDVADTRSIVVNRYDADGQLAFQSYPVRTLDNYATLAYGTRTSYDALGRTAFTRQNAEPELGDLVATTEYLTGFKTRVTNPRGFQTITSYLAYDQPSTDWPVAITHPEGAYTSIVRDVFGKPTELSRRNADTSVWNGRYYAYDAHQRLCKVSEPETGTNAMGYDAAGNLEWSASGQSWSPMALAWRKTRSPAASTALTTPATGCWICSSPTARATSSGAIPPTACPPNSAPSAMALSPSIPTPTTSAACWPARRSRCRPGTTSQSGTVTTPMPTWPVRLTRPC